MHKIFNSEFQDYRHFVLGCVLMGALVMLAFLSASSNANSNGSASFKLHATFKQIQGITMGSPVNIAGIKVGQVEDIALNTQNQEITLTLGFDRDVQLPYDSSIKIVSSGLFGTKSLRLSPGAEFENFESGDMIDYTQDAILLEQVLEDIIIRAETNKLKQQK
ncbi:MAG: MlaD family protein [Alphaproteobacteria bacterium]